MDPQAGKNSLLTKLQTYKRKYYVNRLLKGCILSLALLLSAFLVVNFLEYLLRFNQLIRAILFFSFLSFGLYVMFIYLLVPIWKLSNNGRQISDEEAARQIGRYFPEISDRLLNTLQLYQQQGSSGSLVAASIDQRTEAISWVPFQEAIRFGENKQYLKYLIIPALFLILIALLVPQLLTDSSKRIIAFNREFVPQAPFRFEMQNERLLGFRNEPFPLELSLSGSSLPNQVYIDASGRRMKMEQLAPDRYRYIYDNLRESVAFRFEANGFYSTECTIELVDRPGLVNFTVELDYPAYTGYQDQRLENTGNLIIPEGSGVEWLFQTNHTEDLTILIEGGSLQNEAQKTENQVFSFSRKASSSLEYTLILQNEYGTNKEPISYRVEVIPDEYPKLSLEQFQDTTVYQYIVLGGNIGDDYGFSQFKLHFKTSSQESFSSIDIPFQKNLANQSYYYQWMLDSVDLQSGEELVYYVEVWDNDAINGRKSTKSGTYQLRVPDAQQLEEKIANSAKAAESELEKALEESKDLNEDLKETEDRLRGKKDLNWEDKKALEELLKQKENIEEQIKDLQQQSEDFNEKKNRFKEQSESLQEKSQELQELMNELLDEETRKLYEELQKLLEEKGSVDDIQEQLEQLKNKEYNLEKELERALEMFKRLKMESKLDEVVEKLEELSEEQSELAEESASEETDSEEALEKQEELNEQFDDLQEDMDELQELNQELERPEPLQDTEQDEKAIEEQMDKSSEELQNDNKDGAEDAQKKAGEEMKELSEKMQQMAAGMEMEMLNENLDNLRDIVDNLVKLSFDQEQLIEDFSGVNQSDPRFVELSQLQLKLGDDAQIVEDSLLALANRVFQISSFVTREVTDMNANMNATVKQLRERNVRKALGKQQLTMTSINNLAILLDDVLQQMQQQMADAMGMPSKNKKGKQKGDLPSMSQMQQQLNEQIEGLKKSGKSGRQLSESLAEMIAEQEQIRQAMQELQNGAEFKNGEGLGGDFDQLLQKMEETELDLANKQITKETIERQKEILTRLLEAEDALRERDQDDEREGEQPGDYDRERPKAFEEYILNKQREIELLKTVPVKLNPYYKKEVNEYFERIRENE